LRAALPALLLILLATALRFEAALRPGLWGDEIFSLAVATGHSLEHPAVDASSSLGDFIEARETVPPSMLNRYAQHEENPAGFRRVLRAVLLSDTSPPFYYLLLNLWTRALGTGDAAVRLFSVCWSVLSLWLIWVVGRELGGPRTAWTASLLFGFSPVAIHYSVEARMYSLLWCIGLCLAWSTLRLSRRDSRVALGGLWVLAGAAGLLTHYFFMFVWFACLAWLWLRPRPPQRGRVAALAAVTAVAVLPWYMEVPASLARWRVTGNWLDGDLAWPHALARPLALAWSLLSGVSNLGGWPLADGVTAVVLLLLAIWCARRRSRLRVFASRRLLLWAWVVAVCVGPLVFDVLRHTTTANVPRYVLAGLPAAMLLVALAMNELPTKIHLPLLSAMLLAWLPGAWANLSSTPRPWEPYPDVGARLESWARPGDVVLIHSVPSGVIGVARYLRRELPLVSWVPQLGTRRMPHDLHRMLAGHRRVAFVKIHYLGEPAPAEPWLRDHARFLGEDRFPLSKAEILYFGSCDEAGFLEAPSRSSCSTTSPR
jgi:4-amino-4-deoxy-L-arabinose transferase-like glycosyltransferase